MRDAMEMSRKYASQAGRTWEEQKREMFFGISARARAFGIHRKCRRCGNNECPGQAGARGLHFKCYDFKEVKQF